MSTTTLQLPPDVNRASALNGTAIGLLIPAIIMVALRISVRVIMTKNMGWDDYLMLIGLPLMIVDQGMSIASTKYGVGRHIYYLSTQNAVMALKLNTIAQPINILGFFFVKASILALILRLNPRRLFKGILYTMLVLMLAISLAGVIIAFAQCQPFEKSWHPTMPGHCWSGKVFTDALYILQAITIVSDLCYIIIPIFILWNVQISKARKFSVLGVIALGFASMACSIAAIPLAQELSASTDVSWNIVNLAAVKIGEANVAIIVGCIPPLQPLLKKIRSLFGAPKTKSGTGNSYESRLARLKLRPDQYEILSKQSNGRSHMNNSTNNSLTQAEGMDQDTMFFQGNGAVPAWRPTEIA